MYSVKHVRCELHSPLPKPEWALRAKLQCHAWTSAYHCLAIAQLWPSAYRWLHYGQIFWSTSV